MPPTLILARHGQAAHNVAASAAIEAGLDPEVEVYERWWARDTLLTEHGLGQAATLGHEIAAKYDCYSVWSSPLRRALQTAQAIVADADTIEVMPELRERSQCHGCNCVPDDVLKAFPSADWYGSFHGIVNDRAWQQHETEAQMDERARSVLQRAMQDAPVIVIVTHNHVLRALLRVASDFGFSANQRDGQEEEPVAPGQCITLQKFKP